MENDRQTVEAWLWDFCPGEQIGFVRGHLGMVLFSGDEAEKKLGSLSGGEAARLIFARQMIQKPNVLVLDEPTNHLDLEAIEALVNGLNKFPGTLIFVSHDRWFVGKLADRIIEITPDGINDWKGTYEEYLEKLGDDHLDSEVVLKKARAAKRKAKENTKPKSQSEQKELRRQKARKSKRLDTITEELQSSEQRVNQINEQFCDPTFFDKTPHKEVAKLEKEQKALSAKIDQLMEEWEALEEEMAELAQA